jgi:hypothetical protein
MRKPSIPTASNDSVAMSVPTQDETNLQGQLAGQTAVQQQDMREPAVVDQRIDAANRMDEQGPGPGFDATPDTITRMGLGKYNLRPEAVRISERGGLDTDMRLNPRYRLERDPQATVDRGAIKSAVGKMEDDTATSFLRDFADSYVAAKGTQRFEGRA